MRLLFLLSLVLACGRDYNEREFNPDDAKLAAVIVWQKVYQRVDVPPHVDWIVGGVHVHCLDGQPRELTPDGCIDGYYSYGGAAVVLWEGSYEESALSHELFHAYLWTTTSDGDANHVNRGWPVLVPDAEAALHAAGY